MEIEKLEIPTYSENVVKLYNEYKKLKTTFLSKKTRLKNNIEKLKVLKEKLLNKNQ